MKRRWQDEYGRFLPQESVNLNEEIEEEEVELPFEDVSPILPIESSSRVGPMDTSGLQPFFEVLDSFLDNTALNPPIVNNLVPNVPFQ